MNKDLGDLMPMGRNNMSFTRCNTTAVNASMIYKRQYRKVNIADIFNNMNRNVV